MVSRSFARELEPLLFPIKLYKLASSEEVKSIQWSRKGTAIKLNAKTVKECFVTGVFHVNDHKHVFRQLSYYGFHRISKDGDVWEFQHPNFRADRFDLVQTIRRARKRDLIPQIKVVLPFIERRKSDRLQRKKENKTVCVEHTFKEDPDISEETDSKYDIEISDGRLTRSKRKSNHIVKKRKRRRRSVVQSVSHDTHLHRSKTGKDLSEMKRYIGLQNDSEYLTEIKASKIKDEAWLENNVPSLRGSIQENENTVLKEISHHATLHKSKDLRVKTSSRNKDLHYDHDYMLPHVNIYSPSVNSEFLAEEAASFSEKQKTNSKHLEQQSNREVMSVSRDSNGNERLGVFEEGKSEECTELSDNVISDKKVSILEEINKKSSQNDEKSKGIEGRVRFKIENVSQDPIPKKEKLRFKKQFVLGNSYKWVSLAEDIDVEEKSLEKLHSFVAKTTLLHNQNNDNCTKGSPVKFSTNLPVNTSLSTKIVLSNFNSKKSSSLNNYSSEQNQINQESKQTENLTVKRVSDRTEVSNSILPSSSRNLSSSMINLSKAVERSGRNDASASRRSSNKKISQKRHFHPNLPLVSNCEILSNNNPNMSKNHPDVNEIDVTESNYDTSAVRQSTDTKGKVNKKVKRKCHKSKRFSRNIVKRNNLARKMSHAANKLHVLPSLTLSRSGESPGPQEPSNETRNVNNERYSNRGVISDEEFKEIHICLSPKERQAVVEFLHLQVKNEKMHTWDILESSNAVVMHCAYDALTYDVERTLNNI